jgi:hypothetical protein
MALFQAAKELKAEKAQQAARIAELEAQIATVAPAVDAQPVAWMTKGDWRPWLTTTHPEVAESWRRDKREVFPLYASAQSEGLRKDAVRREAFFEAALRASIHSQYPVTTEYDRGYAKAREDAAAAIRALSQKTAEGEKK